MIIWGFTTTSKLLCWTIAYLCARCNYTNPFKVMKTTRWFTLFFIPLIPHGIRYFIVCPVCRQANELTKEEALTMVAQAAQPAVPAQTVPTQVVVAQPVQAIQGAQPIEAAPTVIDQQSPVTMAPAGQ